MPQKFCLEINLKITHIFANNSCWQGPFHLLFSQRLHPIMTVVGIYKNMTRKAQCGISEGI